MLPDSLPYMKSDEAIARQLTELNKNVELLDSQRGGAERLIDSVVLAAPAALITFANIPNIYEHLVVRWYARGNRNATSAPMYVRFNNDVGANYDMLEIFVNPVSVFFAGGAIGATQIQVGQPAALTAPANAFDMGDIKIFGYASLIGQKVFMARSTIKVALAAVSLYSLWFNGWWRNVGAITEIDIYPLANDFIAGSRFDLYGIQGGV